MIHWIFATSNGFDSIEIQIIPKTHQGHRCDFLFFFFQHSDNYLNHDSVFGHKTNQMHKFWVYFKLIRCLVNSINHPANIREREKKLDRKLWQQHFRIKLLTFLYVCNWDHGKIDRPGVGYQMKKFRSKSTLAFSCTQWNEMNLWCKWNILTIDEIHEKQKITWYEKKQQWIMAV